MSHLWQIFVPLCLTSGRSLFHYVSPLAILDLLSIMSQFSQIFFPSCLTSRRSLFHCGSPLADLCSIVSRLWQISVPSCLTYRRYLFHHVSPLAIVDFHSVTSCLKCQNHLFIDCLCRNTTFMHVASLPLHSLQIPCVDGSQFFPVKKKIAHLTHFHLLWGGTIYQPLRSGRIWHKVSF